MFGRGHGGFRKPIRAIRPGFDGVRLYSFNDKNLLAYHQAQIDKETIHMSLNKDKETPKRRIKSAMSESSSSSKSESFSESYVGCDPITFPARNPVDGRPLCPFFFSGFCAFRKKCINWHPALDKDVDDDSEDSGISGDAGSESGTGSPEVATEEMVTLRDLYWSPGPDKHPTSELRTSMDEEVIFCPEYNKWIKRAELSLIEKENFIDADKDVNEDVRGRAMPRRRDMKFRWFT